MKRIIFRDALFLLAMFLFSFSASTLYAKEIKSGEGDGIVRHRDMILQNAKPGDYLYRNKGKTKKTLVQEDIDYSKKEYNKILKSLLDERPGSIRAIIKEIVEDIGIEMPYPESEAEDVNIHYLNELSGKGVIEYVSSINKRKQIITVMVRESQHLSYFTKKYKTPPWSSKVLSEGTPSIVIFAKKVNSNQNICMSFNENIEQTKRRLVEEVLRAKLSMDKISAAQEYGEPIKIKWDKNPSADKYKVVIKDKSKKIFVAQIVSDTNFSYAPADGFKYPAYISVIAMKGDISGEPSGEVKVKKAAERIDWNQIFNKRLYKFILALGGIPNRGESFVDVTSKTDPSKTHKVINLLLYTGFEFSPIRWIYFESGFFLSDDLYNSAVSNGFDDGGSLWTGGFDFGGGLSLHTNSLYNKSGGFLLNLELGGGYSLLYQTKWKPSPYIHIKLDLGGGYNGFDFAFRLACNIKFVDEWLVATTDAQELKAYYVVKEHAVVPSIYVGLVIFLEYQIMTHQKQRKL